MRSVQKNVLDNQLKMGKIHLSHTECGILHRAMNLVQQRRWRSEFDVLRLIAIFGVIYNHETFCLESVSCAEWIHAIFNGLCKTAVPLFFMMSGALLLEKQEKLSKILKRIAVFLLIAFITTVVQLCEYLPLIWSNPIFCLKASSLVFVNGTGLPGWYAQWYLYAYLGALLFLPLMRCAAKAIDKKVVWYLLASVIVITGVVPMLYALCGIYESMEAVFKYLPYIDSCESRPFGGCVYICYMLLGFGVDRFFSAKMPKSFPIYTIGVIVVCFTISWAAIYYVNNRYSIELLNDNYFQCMFVAPVSVCMFLCIKSLFVGSEISRRNVKILKILGDGVLFVFLFENIFRAAIAEYRANFEEYLNPYFASLTITILTWVSAIAVGSATRLVFACVRTNIINILRRRVDA